PPMDFCPRLAYLHAMPLVTTTKDLARLARRWADAPYITVDTEFVRTSTFFSRLCLVQVADADGAVAVDALAKDIELKPLIEVLQAPGVAKVFHAARQDIEIFWQMAGVIPSPIFDTQVAAMVCGYGESVGYDTLVKSLAGGHIDKSHRFTDWARRPLSEAQVKYALDDVIHLRPVYEKLSLRLKKSGRKEWLEEEMKILTSPETYVTDPKQAWRRMRIRSGSPRFLGRVQALAEWREVEAVKRNVPRNRVISDKDILALASLNPQTPEDVKHANNISNALKEARLPSRLAALLGEAARRPENELPDPAKRVDNARVPAGLTELLKVLLKQRCQEAGVAPKLVATAEEIESFAAGNGADASFLKGWRYHLYGKDARALLEGKLALSAGPKGLKVFPTP
ncbi:MAG TPA: ribonuclease D, partial [Sphingomonadales bacterium]|nr:ribonuclease D [Sphingomonadales bacterium]